MGMLQRMADECWMRGDAPHQTDNRRALAGHLEPASIGWTHRRDGKSQVLHSFLQAGRAPQSRFPSIKHLACGTSSLLRSRVKSSEHSTNPMPLVDLPFDTEYNPPSLTHFPSARPPFSRPDSLRPVCASRLHHRSGRARSPAHIHARLDLILV